MTRVVALAILAAAVVGCGSTAAPIETAPPPPAEEIMGWRAVTSEEGRFSVLMLRIPQARTEPVETPGGVRETHTLHADLGDAAYSVSWSDFDPGFVAQRTPAGILLSARHAVARRWALRTLELRDLELDGHPGVEMRVETREGGVLVARLVLVEHRLYQLVVLTRGAGDETRFLESFRIR